MKKINILLAVIFSLTLFQCGEAGDPRIAKPYQKGEQAFYDFMNDVRLEVAELEKSNIQLEKFTSETKKFLEMRKAQDRYKVVGLYHERGLDREKGAHKYADRFEEGGCVIKIVFFNEDQKSRCLANEGVTKGHCQEVGPYYLYTQVFTANPVSEGLENAINAIITKNVKKHEAAIIAG